MDIPILIALAASVLIIILGIAFFFKTTKPDKAPEVRPRAAPNRLRDGAPRRAQVARNRGLRMRAQANQEPAEVDSDNENERGAARDEVELDGKLGAKKRAKLEAKAEKKAQREAEEKSRADKRQRQEKAEQERKKLEEQEKAEEKLREEEERKVKEEKDKREYDEYLKMKEAFSVEEEGYEEGDQDDQRNVLQEFVDFVKNNKVVVIEDLAAQFKLKTQACIDRIKDLQADDILTGVIDDRGKFIYVSQAEMEAVAKFIRQRGRVSITELAENSNYLINLTPSAAVN